MEEQHYTKDFFKNQMPISKKSASVILPEVYKLVQFDSILDVGCGTGEWLAIAENQLGIKDFKGLDGDYVDKNQLAIKPENFIPFDLKKPFNLNRKFSLVLSAEVAEHLPVENAEQFIETLCNHGDVILFSAAVPGQGGTYHINEQWQDYWVDIFKKKGFVPIDFMRKKFWYTKGIDWWYKQNMLLFAKSNSIHFFPKLLSIFDNQNIKSFNLIHPEMVFAQKGINSSLRRLLNKPYYTIRKTLSFLLT